MSFYLFNICRAKFLLAFPHCWLFCTHQHNYFLAPRDSFMSLAYFSNEIKDKNFVSFQKLTHVWHGQLRDCNMLIFIASRLRVKEKEIFSSVTKILLFAYCIKSHNITWTFHFLTQGKVTKCHHKSNVTKWKRNLCMHDLDFTQKRALKSLRNLMWNQPPKKYYRWILKRKLWY